MIYADRSSERRWPVSDYVQTTKAKKGRGSHCCRQLEAVETRIEAVDCARFPSKPAIDRVRERDQYAAEDNDTHEAPSTNSVYVHSTKLHS